MLTSDLPHEGPTPLPDTRGGHKAQYTNVKASVCSKPAPRPRELCLTEPWIRDRADDRVADRMWFDALMGGYAVWWIERYMRLYEGRWAGFPAVQHGCKTCPNSYAIPQKFNPDWALKRADEYIRCVEAGHDLCWQYDFVMRLFGWMRWDEEHGRALRRFRRADVWIPKKNMKSPELAFVGWYLLCGDGVMGQKVYFGAKDGSQAREIVGGHAVSAFAASLELQSRVQYKINEMLFFDHETRSQMKPLSSGNERNTKSKEGINGSILIDEVHVVDAEFMKRIKRAGISRLEPLTLGVSTAGLSIVGYGKSRQDYGRAVASGEIEDDDYLFVCYEAPQDTDVETLTVDEAVEVARKCNPAWGITITEREFRSDFTESSNATIDELYDLGTYRLNLWQAASSPWMRRSAWDACQDSFTWEDLEGETCDLGLDLSLTRDLTAAVLVFHEPRRVWPVFWIPEETARRRQAKVANMLQWQRDGHLRFCAGKVISQKQILQELTEMLQFVDCRHVMFDPTFATMLAEELEMQGHMLVKFRQSVGDYAAPFSQLEADILDGTLRHPGNPVLDWQVGHCHVHRNRFSKQSMPMRPNHDTDDPRTIDGIAAMSMGYGVLCNDVEELDYYEHNEIEVF